MATRKPENGAQRAIQGRRRVKPTPAPTRQKRALRTNVITTAEYDRLIGDRMTEDAWRKHYRAFAFDCGFRRQYHTYRSDRSDPGFPDDVMLNVATGRDVWIEGKREYTGKTGYLSLDQVAWLDDLARLRDMRGFPEVYVARPSDRAGLWEALADGDGERLHEWCLRSDCKRCNDDRALALKHAFGRSARVIEPTDIGRSPRRRRKRA